MLTQVHIPPEFLGLFSLVFFTESKQKTPHRQFCQGRQWKFSCKDNGVQCSSASNVPSLLLHEPTSSSSKHKLPDSCTYLTSGLQSHQITSPHPCPWLASTPEGKEEETVSSWSARSRPSLSFPFSASKTVASVSAIDQFIL